MRTRRVGRSSRYSTHPKARHHKKLHMHVLRTRRGGEVPLDTQHLRHGTATELSDPAGTLEMPIDAHLYGGLKHLLTPNLLIK